MSIKGILIRILNALKTLQDHNDRPILFADGTVTVNSASMFTIAQITIPANSRYLVLASSYSKTTLSTQQSCYISKMSGTEKKGYGRRSVRVPGTNGGGCATWSVWETGNENIVVAVRCYGYTTSSHTEGGEIVGIPI